jgi:hypothetical protein
MKTISMLALGALLAAAAPAHADQCARNPTPVTDQAASLVKLGASVAEFCEPCGDKVPGPRHLVRSVSVRDGSLIVNGAVSDLAYLYVVTGPGELVNVGVKAGCGAADVSEAIRGGKPTGPLPRTARRPTVRPPMPPPPPRVADASELGGTWDVKLSTRYSSCTAAASPAFAEWTIAFDQGNLALTTDTGGELVGALESTAPRSMFHAVLKPKYRSSGAALRLTMFLKDRLHGWMITSVKTSNASDPVCMIYQEVSATRH